MVRGAGVNARGIVLYKLTQMMAQDDDIDIKGRTTQNVPTTLIQIEQVAVGAVF